jgi:hypothetical protein
MLTDDEIAFLRAKLDEDEATARYSGPALVAWLTYREDSGGMFYTTVAAGGQGDWDPWVADGHELPEPASARVVYDPARALREVDVWRKLLLEYHSAPHDAVYGGTGRETGFRLALSAALKAKIATYDGNPVTGEAFPSLSRSGPAQPPDPWRTP